MGFFSKILEKLGIGKKDNAPASTGMAKPADASKGGAAAKPAGPAMNVRPGMSKDDAMAAAHAGHAPAERSNRPYALPSPP